MGMGQEFGKRVCFGSFRFIVLSIIVGFVSLGTETVEASGSWGSARGGFASGGAWGTGLLSGRAPVRNLLGRLNARAANIGNGSVGSRLGTGLGSGGGIIGNGGLFSGSRGGLLGFGVFNGSRGSLLGGSNGGLLGRRYGSNGGFVGGSTGGGYSGYSLGSTGTAFGCTGTTYAPSYVSAPAPMASPIYSTPIVSAPTYSMPVYDHAIVGNGSNYSMEQSYPVGDYGFEPGYPIETSMFSSMMGTPLDMGMPTSGMIGTPIEGSLIGATPSVSSPIVDGGSIDSMLENGGMPLNQGLILEPTPAGNEYYTPPPSDGSAPAPNQNLPGPADDDSAYQIPQTDSKAVLNLVLPQQAKVYINGKLTRTPGAYRSFVSKRLTENRDYKYQVKAVLVKGGKSIERNKLVTMRPGVNQTVKLDFENAQTTLALKVPKNAKVKLCGKATSQTGPLRQFTTTSLKEGKTWKGYLVSVEYSVNGKTRLEEREINLTAGETRQLVIGMDKVVDQVAVR